MGETSRHESTIKAKKNEGNIRNCVVEFCYMSAMRVIVLEEGERLLKLEREGGTKSRALASHQSMLDVCFPQKPEAA